MMFVERENDECRMEERDRYRKVQGGIQNFIEWLSNGAFYHNNDNIAQGITMMKGKRLKC